jgi:hypothetical protein
MVKKPKAKKRAIEPISQAEQSARFIAAAKAAGVDQSGRKFSKAMDKILKSKDQD